MSDSFCLIHQNMSIFNGGFLDCPYCKIEKLKAEIKFLRSWEVGHKGRRNLLRQYRELADDDPNLPAYFEDLLADYEEVLRELDWKKKEEDEGEEDDGNED